jgi:hypothetical protein
MRYAIPVDKDIRTVRRDAFEWHVLYFYWGKFE